METPNKKSKSDDLEVTISRRGRVRKKSSKLADFDYSDDLDECYERPSDQRKSENYKTQKTKHLLPVKPEEVYIQESMRHELEYEELYLPEGETHLNNDLDDSDEIFSVSSDDSDDDQEIVETKPTQRLHRLEKPNRKRIIENEKFVEIKTQRKDKGKTRYTAYMMWGHDIRRNLLRVNPDLDFSAISKKLGELWARVPSNEKFNWRRKAKRFNTKAKASEGDQNAEMKGTRVANCQNSKLLTEKFPDLDN